MKKSNLSFVEQKNNIVKFLNDYKNALYIGTDKIDAKYIDSVANSKNFKELAYFIERISYVGLDGKDYYLFSVKHSGDHRAVHLVMPKQITNKISDVDFYKFVDAECYENTDTLIFVLAKMTSDRWTKFVKMFDAWVDIVFIENRIAYIDIVKIVAQHEKLVHALKMIGKESNHIDATINALDSCGDIIKKLVVELKCVKYQQGVTEVEIAK